VQLFTLRPRLIPPVRQCDAESIRLLVLFCFRRNGSTQAVSGRNKDEIDLCLGLRTTKKTHSALRVATAGVNTRILHAGKKSIAYAHFATFTDFNKMEGHYQSQFVKTLLNLI